MSEERLFGDPFQFNINMFDTKDTASPTMSKVGRYYYYYYFGMVVFCRFYL